MLPWFSETAETWECYRNKQMSVIHRFGMSIFRSNQGKESTSSREPTTSCAESPSRVCFFVVFCFKCCLPTVLSSEASKYCQRQNCWVKRSMYSAPVTELVCYQPPTTFKRGLSLPKGSGVKWKILAISWKEKERKIQLKNKTKQNHQKKPQQQNMKLW